MYNLNNAKGKQAEDSIFTVRQAFTTLDKEAQKVMFSVTCYILFTVSYSAGMQIH